MQHIAYATYLTYWSDLKVVKRSFIMACWTRKKPLESLAPCYITTYNTTYYMDHILLTLECLVYIFNRRVTQFLPRNIIFASWIMDIFSQNLISPSQMHHLITCFEANLLVNIMRFHSCIETRFEPTALTSFHFRT